MATWRSPSTTPVHIALLSSHAVVIGPAGVDLLPMFEAAALAAGCLREPDKPEPRRRVRPSNSQEGAEAAPVSEPVSASEPVPEAPTPAE